ncbi:hypothetical protein [Streptomyces rochei]|uniref:hypothetical protein n=1 Tax=Streptomyces rochei TaxID=1928 RepID=UPI0037896057
MATKDFAVRTTPHVANLGDLGSVEFVAEVFGDEFLDGYNKVQEAQAALGGETDITKMQPDTLRQVYGAMRQFLGSLMTQESAEVWLRFEVIKGGKVIDHFRSSHQAHEKAAELGATARVQDRSLCSRIPDRVLVDLLEWVTELYGGGNARPTTPSSGSSRASRRAGTPGKGSSPSKASTRTAGRSAR